MDHPSEAPDFLPSLVRPKVALAEVTVIGVVAAILQWQPQPSLRVWILIALIILIGIAAVYGLAKDEFNLRRAKYLLALRLEEGQALLRCCVVAGRKCRFREVRAKHYSKAKRQSRIRIDCLSLQQHGYLAHLSL